MARTQHASAIILVKMQVVSRPLTFNSFDPQPVRRRCFSAPLFASDRAGKVSGAKNKFPPDTRAVLRLPDFALDRLGSPQEGLW